jgi:hypothetical protein
MSTEANFQSFDCLARRAIDPALDAVTNETKDRDPY